MLSSSSPVSNNLKVGRVDVLVAVRGTGLNACLLVIAVEIAFGLAEVLLVALDVGLEIFVETGSVTGLAVVSVIGLVAESTLESSWFIA